MPERTIRLRRRGMNPTKIVFVYCLAFLLVSFHQAGRVADWFEDLALAREGRVSEIALDLAVFFRDRVAPKGPAQLNRLEDWVLAQFRPGAAPRSAPDPFSEPDSVHQLSEPIESAQGPPAVESDKSLVLQNRPPSEPRPGALPYAELPPTYWALDARPDSPGPRPDEPAAGPDDDLLVAARPPQPSFSRRDFPFNPTRVLLLGDSMMLEGLGPPLQRELKKNPGLAVFRDGRYGTGLTRLDNFDWLEYFDQMLDKYEPDLVILTIGANDPQDMVDGGRRLSVGGQGWTEVYAGRVADLLARAETRRVQVFWVGLPVMGREPYGRRVTHINQVADAVCRTAANCRYWDSQLSVADPQGHFTTFLTDAQGRSVRVRAKDSIHLTEAGGRIMAEKFLADTAAWADYRQKPAAPEAGPDQPDSPALAPSAGDQDEPADPGQLTRHRFFSPLRQKETPYLVAKPALEAGQKSRPVVFLLHGAWDGCEAWAERIGAETLTRLAAERGLILVMPDGEPFGWYLDGNEDSIESYLMTELIPRVLAENPEADPDRMALTGLSMGGHGALTLLLKHPETFKAAGSMSGVLDLAAHAGGRHAVDSQLKIDRVLGPAGPDGDRWRPHSARGLTEQFPGRLAGRPLIISVGRGDRLTLAENQAYHRLLTQLKIDHLYQERPGGHDWTYWAAQLPVHLDFLAEHLKAKAD